MAAEAPAPPADLSVTGRWLVLGAAFLGWFFGGFLLSTTTLAMRSAAVDLLGRSGAIDRERFTALNAALGKGVPLSETDREQLAAWKSATDRWFGFHQCALLLGAAAGGLLFGRIGDRFGRRPAMAASVLTYTLFSAAAAASTSPLQLLFLWFTACLGVGGVWPNGVALLAETWSGLSRPAVAGIMGTSANIGIFALATLANYEPITPDRWRWLLLLDAAPAPLGLLILAFVPESLRWLRGRQAEGHVEAPPTPRVFRPPLLATTLTGILLATVPLMGAWGSTNWMIPWAERAAETTAEPDPFLKARIHQARSLTGLVGSLLGGWAAHLLGRRLAYALLSLGCLFCSQFMFWTLLPTDRSFVAWAGVLGFFSGVYFGWLPLCLPELFPTAARSTGAGVSFNFGRILSAVAVLATAALLSSFGGDHARIGRVTSLVYAVGIVAVLLMPPARDPLKD